MTANRGLRADALQADHLPSPNRKQGGFCAPRRRAVTAYRPSSRGKGSPTESPDRRGTMRGKYLLLCVLGAWLAFAAPAGAVSKNVEHLKTLPEAKWATAINFLQYA